MPRPEHRDPKLELRWRHLLGQWRQSQQSVRDFCAEHRLTEASFYAWRREIARRDRERPVPTTPVLLPVRVLAGEPLEIVLPSGPILRVPPGHDPAVIARLVAALEARA